MAELRCPKCGKSNPDILDVCQFCQTPLKKTDSILRIGQTPTKKDTGELESVLPDWLKDVRQQARDSAEEDSIQAAPPPKVEKEEAPDFLAGLTSQADHADDDEIPDWLVSINPVATPQPTTPLAKTAPPTSAPPAESDFFAQFKQDEAKPASESAPKSVPPFVEQVSNQQSGSPEQDDLSKWFAQASEQPEEFVEITPNSEILGEAAWTKDFDPSQPAQQEPTPAEPEDLSWLHNLEDAAKQTGDLQAPKQVAGWTANFEAPSPTSASSQPQEDLSWLNNLGGIEASPQPSAGEDLSWLDKLDTVSKPPVGTVPEKPTSAQPFTPAEDLSWLNNLGGESASSQPAETPAFPQQDLGWLDNLGGTPISPQPVEPVATPPASSQEDLSWLNNLGGAPESPQSVETAPEVPSSSREDLSWLNSLGGESGAFTEPATPSTSAEMTSVGKQDEFEPDWLKSAVETPAVPPADDTSMDWLASLGQSTEEAPVLPAEVTPASQTPPFADVFSTPSEQPPSLAGQDVDSLFSVEMPDWLSHPEPAAETHAPQEGAPPPGESEESLAPVDLPSWVQAMRPVEAVISPTATSVEDQPEEKEGPLAGLRGVIPGAAISSSMRPKPVALKLQATKEQQAGVTLLEKILESETSPRALVVPSFVASQQALRWGLTALFLLVLGVVVALRSQIMQAYPVLMDDGQAAYNAATNIPSGAKVLVVIDYEPSLAGEMETIGGPVLDQMILLQNPQLSFISMSPNGPALVERLVASTKIQNVQYHDLGFLPGGSTGVLGFIENQGDLGGGKFSEYAMVVLMTDHAESGRAWVEQLYARKVGKPLIVLASAQAGPLLRPYWSSGQVTGIVSGLSEAARYEYKHGSRPGTARSYLDVFGAGLLMSVVLIVLGSLWSLVAGIRARRAEAEQG